MESPPAKSERWLVTPWEQDGNVLRAYIFDFTDVKGMSGAVEFERVHITVSKFRMLEASPQALGKVVEDTMRAAMKRLGERRKTIELV